jgi:hypothetical protein
VRGALSCMMSVGASLALAWAVVAPSSAQEAKKDWQTYTYADDGFAIDLPSAPEIFSDRPSGQIRSSRQFQVDIGVGSYVVSATRYARDAKLDQWNDDSMVELANAMKGKCRIRDGRPGTFAGALAYEMVLDQCPDGAVMKVRMYVVGDWVYQVLAVGPVGVDTKPETQKFHDSFKIVQLNEPPPEPDKPEVRGKKGKDPEARSKRGERRASSHRSKKSHARSSKRRR